MVSIILLKAVNRWQSSGMTDPKTELNRLRHKGVTDIDARDEFLKSNQVGTLAFVGDDGFPYQVPIAFGYPNSELYIHGSSAAGGLRQVADGRPVSFGVFRQTGLVLARSAFESSMHYTSFVGFGTCKQIDEARKKDEVLTQLTEYLFPGRSAELRPNTKKELAATLLLRINIEHWSLKTSAGMPDDLPEDLQAPVWAGVVPIQTSLGTPIAAPDLLAEYAQPPAYLKDWKI